MSAKVKLKRLTERGSGPYLVIFRERRRRKPEHKVYYMEDLTTYFNDISFLLGDPVSDYEMIVYEVKLKPIFRVEPISEEKAEEVWLLMVTDMGSDGLVLEKRKEQEALVISVDRSVDEFDREVYERYKEDFGLDVLREMNLFDPEKMALWEQGKDAFTCPACDEVTDKVYQCWVCGTDLCARCGIIFTLKDGPSPVCLDCDKNEYGFSEEELKPGIVELE